MKLKGRLISGPNIEYIVIPRADGDIILKAQAVLDTKPFDTIYPEPKPPKITKPSGVTEPDFKDAAYLGLVMKRNAARYGWIFLTSLSVTEELEWTNIGLDKPDTWHLWEEELRGAGFSNPEINTIMDGISAANGLNQEKLEQARKRFFAGLTPQTGS
jgi:hypothetical protein